MENKGKKKNVGKKAGKVARGTHPNSLSNLEATKFKKGESGNPKGFSKLGRISSYIKTELNKAAAIKTIKNEKGEIVSVEVNKLEMIIRKLADRASKGHIASTEILFDRLEGKPKSGMLNVSDEDEDDTLTEIKISVARRDSKGKIKYEAL